MSLADQQYEACRADSPKMTDVEIEKGISELPDWEVETEAGEPHLSRLFKFKNFAEAMDFTQRVGALAEKANHHPALLTEWGKVRVDWWTHKIGGLHQNDFVMAAQTDRLYGNNQ